MKIILITPRITRKSYNADIEIRNAIDVMWLDLISSFGYLPVIIPVSKNLEIDSFLGMFKTESIRGIILSGGDVPSEDDLRSSLEEELILHSIKSNVPLLGVCRGMQSIARYFGIKSVRVDGHVANQHSLLSTKIGDKIFGKISDLVNSFHEFGLRTSDTSIEFDILFTDESGQFVEAMRHRKFPTLTGIMWHPERDILMNKNTFEKVLG